MNSQGMLEDDASERGSARAIYTHPYIKAEWTSYLNRGIRTFDSLSMLPQKTETLKPNSNITGSTAGISGSHRTQLAEIGDTE